MPARLPHHPGLDGLRGVAVIVVLLFHAGYGWVTGGFLGVSTFFTLSGFLITGLLLGEWDRDGRVHLGRFWSRRFRRLMPALLVALGGIAAFAKFVAVPDQLTSLRADGIAALAYVANWRFVLSGQEYAELFAAPSPLLHTWSLAIEEQFYLLFPIAVVGLLKVGGGRRSVVAGALIGMSLASLVAMLALYEPGTDPSRIYYGTDTRAFELLAGALLAVATTGRSLARRAARVVPVLGVAAFALSVAAWITVSQDSTWLYKGGLAAYSVGTLAIILAATVSGPLKALLSTAPLRWAGLLSYGLYLYHWPVFLWITPGRVGVDGILLLAVRLAVTLALALASYHLVEQPIRRGSLPGWRAALAAPTLALVVGIALVATTVPPRAAGVLGAVAAVPSSVAAAPADAPPLPADPGLEAALTHVRDATAATPLRVVMLGDSVAYDAEPAVAALLQATGEAHFTPGAYVGAGLTVSHPEWRPRWRATLSSASPDLALVLLGRWDEEYVQLNGPDAYRGYVDEAVDLLLESGVQRIALIGLPPSVDRDGVALPRRTNPVYRAVAEDRPEVIYIDTDRLMGKDGAFASHLRGPNGESERIRKVDGVHLCPAGAARVADAVRQVVSPDWGLAPPDGQWRAGEWALDSRYDEPRGSCPA